MQSLGMLIQEAPSHQLQWSRIAGGSLALTGVGHLATELFAPQTSETRALMAALHELHVSLPGAQRSIAELLLGFSLIMGVLLIGSGALIMTARPTRFSRLTAVALTLGASVLAWRYLFVVPGVLTTIAAAAASMAFWRRPPERDMEST
jgi:hypothetical protein